MEDKIFIDHVADILKIRQSRRSFMKKLVLGSAGAAFNTLIHHIPSNAATVNTIKSTVSLVPGTDRRDMVYQALKPFENEIKNGIQDKQVIIKPNLVGNETILCATHPDAIRGVLDFLKPIYKKQILIAESTGRRYDDMAGTIKHYTIYGYFPLEKEYNVKLVDLNAGTYTVEWLLGPDDHPLDIRICAPFLDSNNYFIAVNRLKTHNVLVVTLSAKNMLMGSPFVDGYRHDKSRMHTPGIRKFNFNMFLLAQKVHPQVAVIDGLEGMEGNGPVKGTPVDHGVALASMDFIAADRIGCQLMGIDFGDVGYLTYSAQAGIGQGELSNIKIVGPDPSNYVRKYRMHDDFESMLEWKN